MHSRSIKGLNDIVAKYNLARAPGKSITENMEEIETLQFELESLLHTKTVTELQGFVCLEKLKTTVEGKSKIAALK